METKTTPVHPLLVGTTPGEWNVEDSEYSGITNKVVAGETVLVCVIQPGPIDEVEANAKLIAQAPSLAAENALLADQVERMKKALEPFAEGYRLVKEGHTPTWEDRIGKEAVLFGYCGYELRIDHLRNASELLESTALLSKYKTE